MTVRCPQCGARNDDGALGRPCVSCGRTLPATAAAPRGQSLPARGGRDRYPPIQGLGLDADPLDFGALGRAPDTLEDGPGGGLGAMPTGDDQDPLDLGRLLGRGEPDDQWGGGGVFRFGQEPTIERTERGLGSLDGGFAAFDDDEEATRGNLMVQIPPEALRDSLDLPLAGGHHGEEDEEESTRVVDQGYVEQAMSEAPLLLADAPPVGWRVRNERGVVYELMTVDAVVAWLEGKPDIRGVRVARGDGEFHEVDAFPELAGRLGVRAPAEELLALDTTRASDRHGGRIGENRDRGRPETRAAAAATPREPQEERVGLGVVLAAIAAGFLAVAAIVLVAVALDWMSLPPPIETEAPIAAAPPSKRLAQAVASYDAGHYDAATNLLQALTREEDDPRVWRYLALALHQNNREPEARRALAEYRRRMRGVNGAR